MKLNPPLRNVIIRIQLDNKEKYKFDSGVELEILKGFDFNKRIDSPSFAEVVSGLDIPEGAQCLIHHNSSHETYHVQGLSKEDNNIYSIPEDMIYAWRMKGEKWQAMKDFLITYRIFEEYKGILTGIEPKQVKQRLYVVSGKVGNYEVEGKALFVTPYSDYQIIFHDNARPSSIIRTRLREVLGIDNILSEQIKNGNFLIGNDLEHAQQLKSIKCQTEQIPQ